MEFWHGREKPPTSYEFYNPSIATCHLGFRQLPPRLFLADKLRPREAINQSWGIRQFEDALPPINAEGWKCDPFSLNLFDAWWQEWAQHLFCNSITPFCQSLDPSFQPETEVNTLFIYITLLPFGRCNVIIILLTRSRFYSSNDQ